MSRTSFSHGSWESESSYMMSLDRSSDSIHILPHDNFTYGNKAASPLSSIESFSSNVHIRNGLSDVNEFSVLKRFLSTDMSTENLESSITCRGSRSCRSPQTQQVLEAEMMRLRLKLEQSMELYDSVCKEAALAKQMARELQQWQTVEAHNLEDARLAEEATLSLARLEKQKSKAVTEAVQMAKRRTEIEAQKRRNAEIRAMREAEERKKAREAMAQHNVLYRKYALVDIEVATDYFASSNKIGEGGYGPVYKGVLNHTAVAIKVLRPDISQGQRQFQQEVEVLSSIRHPHMVILLGACPEYGCLVYEYMENGSLEDCLFRKDESPPIPWRTRFNIAFEIATALLFLHESKPEPIVHRDLKPANILLDRNFVGKIGDVGLARLVQPSGTGDDVSHYRLTAAVGTLCYIDPEYQQTGMLTVKSDLYSLGILLLQLVTAQPPMGLSSQIEESIEKGKFAEMLDPSLTDCPLEKTLSFAKLALKCCELRRRDRPDLGSVILPELNRLRQDSIEPVIIREPPCHHDSEREWKTHASQVYTKKGWHRRLKSMTKLWNFRVSPERSVGPARRNQAAGKTNPVQREGCWSSFMSCGSVPHAPIQRFKSFS